ncbi:MAG TPA: RNA polymerase sigma-70 factor [Gemmatimonadaceae bacterium]|jgi:RNA polymerase sigma-70 factor (ECF subfamily)|nr:RNA polymerase sigma-70 factor [Gemmatimonadaceae bacterium]
MISASDFSAFEPTDERLASFAEHRRLLFSIAYRMLGSAADAEDVLQDAYLRWQRAKDADVRSPKDYLSTTVTRLAMDHLRSARVRREVYVGPWLPEPLVGVDAHDPLAASTLADSLSTAFLVLLERLTPTQRAAFLLREAFGFEYTDVARILRTTEVNARQLVQRSKQHLAAGRPRFAPDTKQADELTHRFLTACTTGDVDGLLAMLSDDAVAWADGGGKFAAARRPVTGADRVARFIASLVAKWAASGELAIEPVSGGTGLLFRVAGQLRAVLTLATDADGGQVQRLFIQVNPDKLHDANAP